MGLSARTLSFRNATQSDVVQAYRDHMPERRAFVAPEKAGWVVVLEEAWYDDVAAIPEIALLCRQLRRRGLVLVVDLSLMISYGIYDETGAVVDHSRPDDPCCPTKQQCRGLAGRPELLEAFGEGRIPQGTVERLLADASTIDDAYWGLLDTLGIPFGGLTFQDVACDPQDVGFEDWKEWPQFVAVGAHVRRP